MYIIRRSLTSIHSTCHCHYHSPFAKGDFCFKSRLSTEINNNNNTSLHFSTSFFTAQPCMTSQISISKLCSACLADNSFFFSLLLSFSLMLSLSHSPRAQIKKSLASRDAEMCMHTYVCTHVLMHSVPIGLKLLLKILSRRGREMR